MAIIQSGASATQWTIDTTSEAGRVTFYDTSGNPMSNVSSLGNILNALNDDVTIILGGQSTAGITVTGTTGSLTLSFEATIDSTNWFAINATPIPSGSPVTSTTANGQWVVDLAGFYAVRVRISSFTSGSMTVSVVVTPQNSKSIAQVVSIAGVLPVSGTVTADQGAPNSIANSWPVEITDGYDILGTLINPVRIDPTGITTQPVSVETSPANIDSGNSSTTPLSGSATFTGTGLDVSGYAVIGISAYSNRDGTLKLQFSSDNSNWDASIDYSALANNFIRVTTGPQARFFRVVYVNSGSAQAFFRLQTIEKPIANYPSTVPVDTVIDVDDDAIITKSIITGKTTGGGGGYVDVKVNPSGTLVVDASGSTVPVSGSVSVSGTVTANQGTAAALSGKWPVQVTDGTNTMPTGDAVDRAIFEKITDGANTASVTASSALKVDGSAVTQPVSGTVTAAQATAANLNATVTQGPANSLANAWPVKVTDGTNTLPTGDAVARAIFEKITDGTNTAAVKAASTAPVAADPALVVTLSPNNSLFDFGGDQRLKVGQETLLFFDNIDGTTIDLNRWAQSQSGMTQAQTGGNLTLNSGSSLTSGNYSILTSNKHMLVIVEDPIYVQFRAKLVPQTNAVIELGFGNASTTATPSDGVFFRVDTSGNVKGVLNFGTSETTTANLFSISNTTFYNWEVTIYEDHAKFEVQSADGVTDIDVDLAIPVTGGSPVSVGHLPVFARVYNNSATSSAVQMIIASVNVQQLDLATYKPWAEQMAGANKSANIDPSTFVQSANYTNSTVPATATLSNTVAGYTTLGGLYKFAAVAGAETDYALFAYQVPTGFALYVTGLIITSTITGANSATAATLMQWGMAANSSAVSLATGGSNPPIFTPIGFQTAPKTASIGDIFEPAIITYEPKTPIVVSSGKFFHVVLRIPVSNATASQLIRGSVTIEGYFE